MNTQFPKISMIPAIFWESLLKLPALFHTVCDEAGYNLFITFYRVPIYQSVDSHISSRPLFSFLSRQLISPKHLQDF